MGEVTTNLNAASSIGILARLHNPQGVTILGVLIKDFVVLRVVESFNKFKELSVILSFFYMVGQRNRVKRVLPNRFVENLHVIVDGLLVTQVEVDFLVVRRDHVMARGILLLLFFFLILFLSFASV